MSDNEFKEGDIVQLKSEGPLMSVEQILTEGKIACVWFSGTQLNRDIFNPNILDFYTPIIHKTKQTEVDGDFQAKQDKEDKLTEADNDKGSSGQAAT